MESRDFDVLTRLLSAASSRRALARALAGLVLGLTGLQAEEASASCSGPGTRCGRSGDLACCAGACKKKRGSRKRFCTANRNACTAPLSSCGNSCGPVGSDCICMSGGGGGAGICVKRFTPSQTQTCSALGCPTGKRCIQACNDSAFCLTPCV
jgi:hypothetical protein